MCHETAEGFIKDCVRGYGLDRASSVLQVGCATGPDFSRLFPVATAYGFDLKPGPLVNETGNFETYELGQQFEVVICAEVLEHTLHPWWLVMNLARHTESQGHVIITARGYDVDGCAPVHDAPHDYWRMTPNSLMAMMCDAGLVDVRCVEDPSPEWPGALGVGRRG